MKRSPMPPRKTPLISRVSLVSRVPLQRRTPIAAVSYRRKQENRQRTPIVNALRVAQRGICPRCGRSGLPLFGHERRGRAHGQSILSPDVAICNEDNAWCEDNPQIAAWTGWKVSAKHPHDPALQPWEARALDGSIVDFRMLQADTGDAA